MTEDEVSRLAATIILNTGIAIANAGHYDGDRQVTVDEVAEMVREGIRQGYLLGKFEAKVSNEAKSLI